MPVMSTMSRMFFDGYDEVRVLPRLAVLIGELRRDHRFRIRKRREDLRDHDPIRRRDLARDAI